MPKYLDQEKVTEYALLKAEIEKLQKRQQDLRLELIEGFEDGLKCPREGPYLLVLGYQNRREISWKEEYVIVARELYGKAWRKHQAAIVKEAPQKKVPNLRPKTNPAYKATVTEITKRTRGAA